MFDFTVVIIYASIHALVPLLIAGLGELVVEKSGVLNLGIEGMMLVGCVAGFIISVNTESIALGFLVAAISAMLLATMFALLTVILRTNQVATGLALTIFGIGLSSFLGLNYVGEPLDGLQNIHIPWLSEIPVIGKLLFQHDVVVYFAFILLALVYYFLYKTRTGLIVCAVGDNHNAAYSMGYSVVKVRFLAILFGGAMAGIAGAYLSLVYTPLWSEQMTAGRGWIVMALVVFSTWRPDRLLLGSFLFGIVSILQLFLQGGEGVLNLIPTEFFAMLPYIITIVVLVTISASGKQGLSNAPASLGVPFEPK